LQISHRSSGNNEKNKNNIKSRRERRATTFPDGEKKDIDINNESSGIYDLIRDTKTRGRLRGFASDCWRAVVRA
jgi:hypothetical protein|tara:strand:- start:802 stop:1023 length:222 start_codon:yes stop_codon:yes gene_type:complete